MSTSTVSKPTFAQQVGGTAKNLKRPNCLNFKTKSYLKRLEIIEMLKHIEYPTNELVGVAEMKGRSIDITCRTRENVLELYLKLKRIDYVYNLSLYETENVRVLIGWVLVLLPNERIKNHIQTNFGKIVTITEKHHKDGLISGIRIVTINKRELEQKPLPSYIMVDGFELYVTCQNATCRYCSEIGHVQSASEKRKTDFPSLRKEQRPFSPTLHNTFAETNQSMRGRDYAKPSQSSDCSISEQNDVISCSYPKKRKIRFEPDSNMNKNCNKGLFISDSHSEELAQTITEIPLNTTNAADNLMRQGDSDNSSNRDKTQQEISSASIAENNDQTNQDWWKISCQAYCYICKTENAIDESTNKYECADCGEEQYVAQPCCADQRTFLCKCI